MLKTSPINEPKKCGLFRIHSPISVNSCQKNHSRQTNEMNLPSRWGQLVKNVWVYNILHIRPVIYSRLLRFIAFPWVPQLMWLLLCPASPGPLIFSDGIEVARLAVTPPPLNTRLLLCIPSVAWSLARILTCRVQIRLRANDSLKALDSK